MISKRKLLAAMALAAGLGAASCHSSSGSSTPIPTSSGQTSNELVGVLTDYDGDGNLDVLHVSTETSPVQIVQLLIGDGQGRFVDDTANLSATTLDDVMSQAILARLRKGAPKAKGLEAMQVNRSGSPTLVYLIFG